MGSCSPNQVRSFPDKDSECLILTHPTPSERKATWTLNANSWGKALGLDNYLEREDHLLTAPLAENGGITHWILVDGSLPENERQILSSCESLRKPALIAKKSTVREVITHGIGSVFTQEECRGRGYAGRMLRELSSKLKTHQVKEARKETMFSILYSDIGKKFYAKYGWQPFPSTHVEFPAKEYSHDATADILQDVNLEALCGTDVALVGQQFRYDFAESEKTHVVVVPNHDQMRWHHIREDFMASKIWAGKLPNVRGAISKNARLGHRVWAIWTRSFYDIKPASETDSTLHILRLVVEDRTENSIGINATALQGILEIAQHQAALWKLKGVELWNPDDYLKCLLSEVNLVQKPVLRVEDSIPSLMWYGAENGDSAGKGKEEEIVWEHNQKYAWC